MVSRERESKIACYFWSTRFFPQRVLVTCLYSLPCTSWILHLHSEYNSTNKEHKKKVNENLYNERSMWQAEEFILPRNLLILSNFALTSIFFAPFFFPSSSFSVTSSFCSLFGCQHMVQSHKYNRREVHLHSSHI